MSPPRRLTPPTTSTSRHPPPHDASRDHTHSSPPMSSSSSSSYISTSLHVSKTDVLAELDKMGYARDALPERMLDEFIDELKAVYRNELGEFLESGSESESDDDAWSAGRAGGRRDRDESSGLTNSRVKWEDEIVMEDRRAGSVATISKEGPQPPSHTRTRPASHTASSTTPPPFNPPPPTSTAPAPLPPATTNMNSTASPATYRMTIIERLAALDLSRVRDTVSHQQQQHSRGEKRRETASSPPPPSSFFSDTNTNTDTHTDPTALSYYDHDYDYNYDYDYTRDEQLDQGEEGDKHPHSMPDRDPRGTYPHTPHPTTNPPRLSHLHHERGDDEGYDVLDETYTTTEATTTATGLDADMGSEEDESASSSSFSRVRPLPPPPPPPPIREYTAKYHTGYIHPSFTRRKKHDPVARFHALKQHWDNDAFLKRNHQHVNTTTAAAAAKTGPPSHFLHAQQHHGARTPGVGVGGMVGGPRPRHDLAAARSAYVVPTLKKRSDVVWDTRNQLAYTRSAPL